MLEIGSLIDGKYKILNKIGQGGMSVVYLAMNERANKQWAIKEVRKDGVSNFEVVKQGLVAEVDMLKKLNHPHLPSIIDVIDGDGSFLIVMDYIEGVSLNKKLKEAGALPQEDVIEWGKQLCDVLGYLHSRPRPIIYRDMKPANVMLRPDGDVMLIDFGTAREFKSNSVADTTCLGTQGYAAPEQFGGQGQTDARTDIYCLGATLYHLVTGHNPCEYPYEMYPIRQWNPTLSSGLEEIILKCTQKNPNDRYQSCAELMYALEHYKDFEIETRRAQNIKLRSFVSMVVASAVLFVGSAGFKIFDIRDREYKYNNALTHTESYLDFENGVKEAALLKPRNVEPYKKAVEVITGDYVFTTAENTALVGTLLDPSNTEPVDRLKQGTNEYYRFAYELAIAYFFYYENDLTGLANSQKWFKEASSSPIFESEIDDYGMTEEDIRNAQVLEKLAGAVAYKNGGEGRGDMNVTQVGVEDPTGKKAYTEQDYWNDLTSILDLDFFENSNTVTKRKVYGWILSCMKTDYVALNSYGVSEAHMLAVRDKAIVDLNNLLGKINLSDTNAREQVNTLISQYETVDQSWK